MKNVFNIPTLCILIRHNGSSRTYKSAVKCRKVPSTPNTSDITAREDRSQSPQPRRFRYTVSITLLFFKKRSNTGPIRIMLDGYLLPAV